MSNRLYSRNSEFMENKTKILRPVVGALLCAYGRVYASLGIIYKGLTLPFAKNRSNSKSLENKTSQ